MKILFRVDGGEEIGFGHIMRTLVLAKELSKNHEVKYICLDSPKYIKGIEKIKNENIDVIKIDKLNEMEQIKNIESDFVVVDKYDIQSEYLLDLKSKFKVIYFDDNADFNYYPVDCIINQNIYASELNYNCLKDTKLLLGSRYTMLREEFRKNNPIKVKKNIQNVLITVGGSDDFNITEDIIVQLRNLQIKLQIVIGNAFKFKTRLKKYESSNIVLHENPNMSEIMKKCDVAISTCGSTIYELCFLGIPTIGMVIADNQIKLGKYMNKIGAIKLSNISGVKEDILNLNYNERESMSKIQKNIIDGKGVFRVKNGIEMYDK
ncbi:UDP-2,4-diacetamido-2,4,6-trideoxy-beta-L-altropyranose hydrolase [Clostridium massiliodielmoense]|uniref:UDP-2,4-diacetamido-2,4, 6-trideoxy-beta-L-altropyranose hydrolase n=1 Tax=Clostridium massiliodielmoense TaxID=1776385 RepID=UPI0004D89D45|nr:UDP-2,4-diacetamido-2,4,6-trideoxy-beta-L-altropyranose hydrolase [Clostridium massiliodielmoense]KEH94440.1 hypothetical protein Z962_09395 [Clostridium botulinum C/D str. BKT12695]